MLPTGVEPVTLGLLDPRSNRLSYESYTPEETATETWRYARLESKIVLEVGFEPTKLAHENLSLTPLTNSGTPAPWEKAPHANGE